MAQSLFEPIEGGGAIGQEFVRETYHSHLAFFRHTGRKVFSGLFAQQVPRA